MCMCVCVRERERERERVGRVCAIPNTSANHFYGFSRTLGKVKAIYFHLISSLPPSCWPRGSGYISWQLLDFISGTITLFSGLFVLFFAFFLECFPSLVLKTRPPAIVFTSFESVHLIFWEWKKDSWLPGRSAFPLPPVSVFFVTFSFWFIYPSPSLSRVYQFYFLLLLFACFCLFSFVFVVFFFFFFCSFFGGGQEPSILANCRPNNLREIY